MSDTNVTPMPTEFGIMVRAQRTQLKLSREQAAAIAEVSEARWRHIENGWQQVGDEYRPTSPNRLTVRKIAAALDLPLDAALLAAGYEPDEDDTQPPPEVHQNHRFLRLWKQMDDTGKSAVHEVMRALTKNANRVDEPESLAS